MVMSSSLEYRICAPVTRYSASGLWEETVSAIGDMRSFVGGNEVKGE